MSDDPLRQLRELEADYPGQPLIAQQADLRTINRLREQLGMRLVDAHLNEIGAAVPKPPKPKPVVPAAPKHLEARAIYEAYLTKVEELEPHRAYAERVARATSGPGQTPVRPLATMGTGGGPLLCDHCGKAILLEGGKFHNVTADVAWRQSDGENWNSWILGGLVVEIATNGTLRIYHGYPGGGNKHCCNAAKRKEEKAQEKFDTSQRAAKFKLLHAFVEEEFADKTPRARNELLNDILNTMYEFDPGIGVNRPDTQG